MARTVLPSGLRIVTEEEKSVRPAAFGIWVNVGSRDETVSTAGASHFLEHLLFKGTKRRSSLEISSAIEAVGGETNAFTSSGKEVLSRVEICPRKAHLCEQSMIR